MRHVVLVGDGTTHGGRTISGSERMKINGKGVVRKGDLVSCPQTGHGVNPVVEGDQGFTDEGIPVALDGHLCACGCKLIASSNHFSRP